MGDTLYRRNPSSLHFFFFAASMFFSKWMKNTRCQVKKKKEARKVTLTRALLFPQQTPKATSAPAPGPTRTPPGQWVSPQRKLLAVGFPRTVERTCVNLPLRAVLRRGPGGNRPGRDDAQETRRHGARVHPLLQWVARPAVLHWVIGGSLFCSFLLFSSAKILGIVRRSLSPERLGAEGASGCIRGLLWAAVDAVVFVCFLY